MYVRRTSELLLVMLAAAAWAQSGDGRSGTERHRLSCSSDITTKGNSLTCELLQGQRNDEDDDDDEDEDEDDSIQRMSLCATDWTHTPAPINCEENSGNTLNTSKPPVVDFHLTVHLRRGGTITTTLDLKKIVKPRCPHVRNVTFNPESNLVVIHIYTPHVKDYLRADNQLFQLHIWSSDSAPLIQNMTSETNMKIDMQHLRRNTKYHVKVRAIPVKLLKGFWSEWSDTFTFITPTAAARDSNDSWEVRSVPTLGLVPLVAVIISVVFFWKKKIFLYMWPNIPHPKDTLVHICKPNPRHLLNFKPEVFSVLRVSPLLQTEIFSSDLVQTTDPVHSGGSPSDQVPSTDPVQSGSFSSVQSGSSSRADTLCSTQTSDCRSATSISTEELELAALLGRGSSDSEEDLQSTSPSPLHVSDGAEHSSGAGQQEEAYVTMSSFYQSK
ncbi:interleukin-7 receptor subunit alpha-like isoform X2 [Solea solea]|uniref:interleukin-7 receptor subunit alpha-like isoform X2 n=1 Tax=Solea solea TaxID=90069 RepID=UPI00272D1D61|nr:interleukin-7 receptor subunit alpha-like isoform X2 [Solea solea]